jgi:hypothetical protein
MLNLRAKQSLALILIFYIMRTLYFFVLFLFGAVKILAQAQTEVYIPNSQNMGDGTLIKVSGNDIHFRQISNSLGNVSSVNYLTFDERLNFIDSLSLDFSANVPFISSLFLTGDEYYAFSEVRNDSTFLDSLMHINKDRVVSMYYFNKLPFPGIRTRFAIYNNRLYYGCSFLNGNDFISRRGFFHLTTMVGSFIEEPRHYVDPRNSVDWTFYEGGSEPIWMCRAMASSVVAYNTQHLTEINHSLVFSNENGALPMDFIPWVTSVGFLFGDALFSPFFETDSLIYVTGSRDIFVSEPGSPYFFGYYSSVGSFNLYTGETKDTFDFGVVPGSYLQSRSFSLSLFDNNNHLLALSSYPYSTHQGAPSFPEDRTIDLVKIDVQSKQILWKKSYKGDGNYTPLAIRQLDNGNYVVLSIKYDWRITQTFVSHIMILDQQGNELSNRTFSGLNQSVTVFPNPSTEYVVFEMDNHVSGFVEFYDSSGRIARSKKFSQDENQVRVDVADLPAGVYPYIIFYDDKTKSLGKIIVK